MNAQIPAAPILAPHPDEWIEPGVMPSWVQGSAPHRWVLQQRRYSSNSHRNYTVNTPPVQFVVNGVRGIRLSDALANNTQGLEDGESNVLENSGQKVSYRLEFPGYDSYHKTKYAKSAGGESITRARMAFHIAEVVSFFMQDKRHVDPGNGYWRIGPGGLTMEHLYLRECHQMTKGSYQVVLEFDYIPPPPQI